MTTTLTSAALLAIMGATCAQAQQAFPCVTIENVYRVDDSHIVVANDNTYPVSVGRAQGQADDNEIMLLDVRDFLMAE